MKTSLSRKGSFATTTTASLLLLLNASCGTALAQEKPEQVPPERARANNLFHFAQRLFR